MTDKNLDERINSAATPELRGAREEREKIAEFLEAGADYWDKQARGAQNKPTYEWRDGNASLLRAAAREIRDGAHHEERE